MSYHGNKPNNTYHDIILTYTFLLDILSFQGCPDLKELQIMELFPSLSDKSLTAIAAFCKELHSLRFSGNDITGLQESLCV